MVQSDSDPVLQPSDLQALVKLAQRVDAFGLPSSDPSWTPTYDLNAAAAEGWRWKAGSAAGQYDWTSTLQAFKPSQVVAMCQAQAKLYAARTGTSVSMPGSTAETAGGVPFIHRPLP
jgi:hypothetical protein